MRASVVAAALIAFLAAVEYAFATVMVPRFSYLGYAYVAPSRSWMLVSLVLLALTGALLPWRVRLPSQFVAWFMFVTVAASVAIVPYYGSAQAPGVTFAVGVIGCLIVLAVGRLGRREVSAIVPIAASDHTVIALLVLLSAGTYLYLVLVFGFNLDLVGFFSVRDTRLLYRDETIPGHRLLGYLISNQSKVVNPLLVAVGITHKRWLVLASGVVGQLYVYSATGYRSAVLGLTLAGLLGMLLRHRSDFLGVWVLWGSAVASWSALALDRAAGLGATDLVVARIFIVAGRLTPAYFQVYGEGGWAYWSHSFMSAFLPVREEAPGSRVPRVLWGRPDISANANLLADGYANFGFVGIAIEAAFLLVVLVFLNSSARRLRLYIWVPTLVSPVWSLANTSPITALLSSGFLLSIIVFALMPRARRDSFPSLHSGRPGWPRGSLTPD